MGAYRQPRPQLLRLMLVLGLLAAAQAAQAGSDSHLEVNGKKHSTHRIHRHRGPTGSAQAALDSVSPGSPSLQVLNNSAEAKVSAQHQPVGTQQPSSLQTAANTSAVNTTNTLTSASTASPTGGSTASAPIMFITWIAFGDAGDAGWKTHNFHKVDMRWAEVARRSHPNCAIGLVMDQDTQLANTSQVDMLHRLTIDKAKFGRNEYNDLYHWAARYSMLEKLAEEGKDHYNVVFMDPDVLVVGNLSEAFSHPYDYAVTISENAGQPINGAMHFVHAKRYTGAVQIIKGVLDGYQINHEVGFTSGQRAYSDYMQLTDDWTKVKQLNDEAVRNGASCLSARGNEVCFLTCLRFNFWEDCNKTPDLVIQADKAADYVKADVKVLHMIAYRKLGIQEVYDAYMPTGSQEAALKAFAALPHTEAGFEDSTRFSSIA